MITAPLPHQPEDEEDPLDDDGLSVRHRLFVAALLGPAAGNATKAAELAGYKSDNRESLKVTATRTLHRPFVQQAIARAIAKRRLSAEWIRIGLAEIAASHMSNFLRPDGAGNFVTDLKQAAEMGALGQIKELREEQLMNGKIRHTIKLHDRQGALTTLARIYGMMNDSLTISGSLELRERKITHAMMARVMGDPDAHAAMGVLADRITQLGTTEGDGPAGGN